MKRNKVGGISLIVAGIAATTAGFSTAFYSNKQLENYDRDFGKPARYEEPKDYISNRENSDLGTLVGLAGLAASGLGIALVNKKERKQLVDFSSRIETAQAACRQTTKTN